MTKRNLADDITTIGYEVIELIISGHSSRANKLEQVRANLTKLNGSLMNREVEENALIEYCTKIAKENGIELSDSKSVFVIANELIESLISKDSKS